MIDFEPLLAEISEDAPCGDNLEYDPAFGELERLCQVKDEVQYGDTVVEAEPPDWKAVVSQSLVVLERTRDLRVAINLARGVLETEGLEAFAGASTYIGDLIEQRWDSVHPQLDPDDDNDPTIRVNALGKLRETAEIVGAVRTADLIASRAIGRFSIRDFEIANGEVAPAEGAEPPSTSLISGAAQDVGPAEISRIAAAVNQSIEQIRRIESTITEKVGVTESIDLSPLVSMLQKAATCLAPYVADESDGQAQTAADNDAAAAGQQAGQTPMATVSVTAGSIQNTDDVKKLIDKICLFYEESEPSSPVPLLLKRAKNLVAKNFFQIIEDIAPDAVDQVQRISGSTGSEEVEE